MEEFFEKQMNIIEQEMLISCKANLTMSTLEERVAVMLESQDLHILCKLAKSNNIEVICYDEEKINTNEYHIDVELAKNNYQEIFYLIEQDIVKYNDQMKKMDFQSIHGLVFYFIAYGKYYIQKIQYENANLLNIPTAKEKLNEIIEKWTPEIERVKEEREAKRQRLMKEFADFVKKDPRFVPQNNGDYARSVFISNEELEEHRKLFYPEDDIRCESRIGIERCMRELNYIREKLNQERKEYRRTEEYAKRMCEFEEFVRADKKFWEHDFPGYRRDYSYQLFLTNPQAAKFRTLFYAESDIECKEYSARRDCFYQLERIYNARKN